MVVCATAPAVYLPANSAPSSWLSSHLPTTEITSACDVHHRGDLEDVLQLIIPLGSGGAWHRFATSRAHTF